MATDLLEEQYKNLQKENDQCKTLNTKQKEHLASLEKEAIVLKSKVQEKGAIPGGILKQQRRHNNNIRKIRILENHLNKDTIKLDNLMWSNMKGRKEIAHLLHQKDFLSNIEEKMNRHLARQKNIVEKLEERSVLLSKHRSEAESRISEIKKSFNLDTAKFNERRAQLKSLITTDTKLLTFLGTKFQNIVLAEEDEASKNRKKEQLAQKGVIKLDAYMHGYQTLQETTGESDLHKIGLMFTQNEQKNFSSLRYVNELHNKRNMLRNQIEKLKRDIQYQGEQHRGHDEQCNSHLQDLKLELETYSSRSASLQEQHAAVLTSLAQLATAISGLFDEILQEVVVVNVGNIVHFTNILEERIVNLLMQSNANGNEQMELTPQKFDSISKVEAVVETARGKSATRKLS